MTLRHEDIDTCMGLLFTEYIRILGMIVSERRQALPMNLHLGVGDEYSQQINLGNIKEYGIS